MKFSIITVCLNSEKTILYTLNSILNQTYKNIEHIIIDGGSTDRTLEIIKNYPFKNKKIFSTNSKGIYSAINEGIKKATGDYIAVLHSDDIYQNNYTLEQVSKVIKENKEYEIFLGNAVYFRNITSKISRYYSAFDFELKDLKYGIIPPHTASFINKNVYRKFGNYKTNYIIASDFDLATNAEPKQLPMSVEVSVGYTIINDYRPQMMGRVYSLSPYGTAVVNMPGQWLSDARIDPVKAAK